MRIVMLCLCLCLCSCAVLPPAPPPPMTAKEAAVEEERLAEEARRKVQDQKARDLLAVLVAGKPIASRSLIDVAGAAMAHVRPGKDVQFQPATLSFPGAAAPSVLGSAMNSETFWVWHSFGAATSGFNGMIGPRSAAGWANRQRDMANVLLYDRLGGDLFDLENPGHFRRPQLDKLLSGLLPKPKQKLWGTTARAAYPVFQPVVREYAACHKVLTQNGGRDRLLAEAASYEAANPQRNMAAFYDRYAKKARLAQSVSLRRSWTDGFITGFWLRRMRDGTDDVIAAYLHKVLASYDPKFSY